MGDLTRQMREDAEEVKALAAFVNELATKQAEAIMAQHAFFRGRARRAVRVYADRGEEFAIDVLGRLEKDPWWGSRPETCALSSLR